MWQWSRVVPSAPTTASTPGVFGPTPIPVISGPYAISGVVAESGRSIAGANVNAWVNQGTFGYSYRYVHGTLLTEWWRSISDDGFAGWCGRLAPGLQGRIRPAMCRCPRDAPRRHGDGPRARLEGEPHGIDHESAPGFRSVSGTIVEMTSAGKQPVAGAFVDFEPLEDFP